MKVDRPILELLRVAAGMQRALLGHISHRQAAERSDFPYLLRMPVVEETRDRGLHGSVHCAFCVARFLLGVEGIYIATHIMLECEKHNATSLAFATHGHVEHDGDKAGELLKQHAESGALKLHTIKAWLHSLTNGRSVVRLEAKQLTPLHWDHAGLMVCHVGDYVAAWEPLVADDRKVAPSEGGASSSDSEFDFINVPKAEPSPKTPCLLDGDCDAPGVVVDVDGAWLAEALVGVMDDAPAVRSSSSSSSSRSSSSSSSSSVSIREGVPEPAPAP